MKKLLAMMIICYASACDAIPWTRDMMTFGSQKEWKLKANSHSSILGVEVLYQLDIDATQWSNDWDTNLCFLDKDNFVLARKKIGYVNAGDVQHMAGTVYVSRRTWDDCESIRLE